MSEPLLLNTKAAANYLGVHVTTLRRWRRTHQLDHCLWTDPTTGYVWYKRPALDDWAAQRQAS